MRKWSRTQTRYIFNSLMSVHLRINSINKGSWKPFVFGVARTVARPKPRLCCQLLLDALQIDLDP
jgi:hypothetical protein